MNTAHIASTLCTNCQRNTVLPPLRAVEPRLLQSAYTLSELEVDEMINILKEEELEKEQYEREIDRARQHLETLKGRKQELEANMTQRRSTYSALRRTPTEIWEAIFTEVCSSTSSGYSLTIDLSRLPAIFDSPPIALSQVCSRWRCIALGSPELWTSMSIQFSNILGGCHRVVSAFLLNSRERLLDVRVQARGKDYDSEATAAIWTQLSHHFSRCWRLTLDTTNLSLPKRLADAQHLSFPNLTIYEGETTAQSAWLREGGWDGGWKLTGSWWNALKNAPKLIDVTACFLHSPTTLPYSQLTTLKFRCLDPLEVQNLFQTLPVCERLESLKLGCVDQVPLTMAAEYRLSTAEVPSLPQLLGSLLLPSLTSFDLRCEGFTLYRGWPPALLDMLPNPHTEPTLASALLDTVPELEILRIAMERERHVSVAHYRAHAEFFVRDIFNRLGDSASRRLPKITDVSLLMSNISLDVTTLGDILGAVATAKGVFGAEDGSQLRHRAALNNVSITRLPPPAYLEDARPKRKVGRPKVVELPADVKRRMEELQREGLNVVIQDFDGLPEELESMVQRKV
ncbi:hypothetical protein AAF712_006322 [Marasmius tenuissimus]|uniref:F-box domain-containing protein n=1 Tax=Marasmius tenuissimus TaxID=585030 RepID=A0ABR3A2B5_9AGAR